MRSNAPRCEAKFAEGDVIGADCRWQWRISRKHANPKHESGTRQIRAMQVERARSLANARGNWLLIEVRLHQLGTQYATATSGAHSNPSIAARTCAQRVRMPRSTFDKANTQSCEMQPSSAESLLAARVAHGVPLTFQFRQ